MWNQQHALLIAQPFLRERFHAGIKAGELAFVAPSEQQQAGVGDLLMALQLCKQRFIGGAEVVDPELMPRQLSQPTQRGMSQLGRARCFNDSGIG